MSLLKITSESEYRMALEYLEQLLSTNPGNADPGEINRLIKLIEEYEMSVKGENQK